MTGISRGICAGAVVLMAMVAVLILLAGCNPSNKQENEEDNVDTYNATLELVQEINHNSDFYGLELLVFSELTKEQVTRYNPEYPEPAMVHGAKIDGYYFPYPTNSEDRRLTQIFIKEQPYHVYGITVGQHINEATPVLEEKGYEQIQNISLYEDTDRITYRQHHVSIFLYVYKDTELIKELAVSVYDEIEDDF